MTDPRPSGIWALVVTLARALDATTEDPRFNITPEERQLRHRQVEILLQARGSPLSGPAKAELARLNERVTFLRGPG